MFDQKQADRAAGFRRQNPHPLHAALAERLGALHVGFVCEHKINGKYADFALVEHGLVIELDGSEHDAERDAKRDAVIHAADWEILRFPHTLSVRQMSAGIMAWIAANEGLCHHCRTERKSGRRYCKLCSAAKQASYRTRQLGLPPAGQTQSFLFPGCECCGGTGWRDVREGVVRCDCRKSGQVGIVFGSPEQIERQQQEAIRAGWRKAAAADPPTEEDRVQLQLIFKKVAYMAELKRMPGAGGAGMSASYQESGR